MLSEIAISDPKAFTELVKTSKEGKAGKIKPTSNEIKNEVTVGLKKETKKETKSETKKETKSETKKTTDYSKMTVAELKEVAKKKKIDVTGMKKAEIVEALNK